MAYSTRDLAFLPFLVLFSVGAVISVPPRRRVQGLLFGAVFVCCLLVFRLWLCVRMSHEYLSVSKAMDARGAPGGPAQWGAIRKVTEAVVLDPNIGVILPVLPWVIVYAMYLRSKRSAASPTSATTQPSTK